MTQEEKQLLLKDLCARIPYRVIVELTKYKKKCHLCGIDEEDLYLNIDSDPYSLGQVDIKPYLRPMSSMTLEEMFEFIRISDSVLKIGEWKSTCILSLEQIDWLNVHHFDYRGLIEKGLALEAPEGMYKTE